MQPHQSRTRPARRRLAVLAACAVAVSSLVATTAAVAAPPAAPTEATVSDSGMVQYQVRPTNGDMTALADALSADGYDVYGGGEGVIFVHAAASAQSALEARSDLTVVAANPLTLSDTVAPTSQDALLPAKLQGKAYPTFYGGYRTVDGYVQFTDDLEDAYPKLVKVIKYGDSYTGDNDLRVVCVTAAADKGCKLQPDVDKARFLFVGQIHARELTTSEMIWRTLTLLTDEYGSDADITALLDETEIWMIPQINPDGIEEVERGFLGQGGDTYQRKNMHKEQECGFGQIGVDLNRNYATSTWGGVGTSPDPCDETYHGMSAGSEPETETIQDLVAEIFEDQRGDDPGDPAPDSTRGTLLSLHSYSNLVLFPYGDAAHTPNDAGLRSLGFRFSYYNSYRTGEPDEILYQVTGSTDDYTYEKLGVAAYTFEIGPGSGGCGGFHPSFSCQDGFWDLNKEAFLYAARAAQQPYVMGKGPNTTQAKAKIKSAKKVKVTATADDNAYGNNGVSRPSAQNVTDGRVFVGKAPWDGGTAKAMKRKGSGTDVKLVVKLKRKKVDKLVWIQAKDADGNWGPTRAVWLKAR